MAGLKMKQRKSLENEFGSRVSFDRLERKLYSHDIAVMPGLFKPLVGSTVPDAVVLVVTVATRGTVVPTVIQNPDLSAPMKRYCD